MSFHRRLSLALLALVLALAVLVPVLGSTETQTQGSDDAAPLAGWRLRDHEANHTGNGTEPDPDHDHDHDHGNGTEHHHEEEALHEIFAMFDQDNDTLLSEHELELLHAAMFPEFGTHSFPSFSLGRHLR
jgi:ABC-type nickel/cobalt efflux system permease component RcnA